MLDEFGQEKIPMHRRMLYQARERQEKVLRENQERWEQERQAASGGLFAKVAPWIMFAGAAVGGLQVLNNNDANTARHNETWESKVRPEGEVTFLAKTVVEETVIAETHVEKRETELTTPVNIDQLTP